MSIHGIGFHSDTCSAISKMQLALRTDSKHLINLSKGVHAALGKTSPPPGSEKGRGEGEGPRERAREKNWNVRRVVAPAKIKINTRYKKLSDIIRYLSTAINRRGIYFGTAIRTAFSPCDSSAKSIPNDDSRSRKVGCDIQLWIARNGSLCIPGFQQ